MAESNQDTLLPDVILADLLLAQALNHRAFQREDEAAQCLDRLLELQPDHIPALNEKGLARMAHGDLEEAAGCFSKILEIEPHDPYAANRLGMLLREKGELAQAEALFRDATEDYRSRPEEAKHLAETPEGAAMVLVANTILNLDSALTR